MAPDRNKGGSGREEAQSSPPGRPLPPPQGARVRLDAAPAPLPPRKPSDRRSPCDGIAVTHQTAHWPLGQFRLRSEEHTSELPSLMRISYAVFCLKKKTTNYTHIEIIHIQQKA